MKKRYLLFISIGLIFISRPVFSQLHVVKDNIKCAYGLKDTNHVWVVKPIYVEIRELVFMINSSGTHEGFEVSDGRHRGIFSTSGKLVIPISQDYIMAYAKCYIGSKNDKLCIFNLDGKALTEHVYDRIKPYGYSPDYFWCYKDFQDSIVTSLIELNTGFLFKDVPGYVRTWADSTYTIFQKREHYNYANYDTAGQIILPPEFGIIDTNGTIILPRIYNEILIKKKYFIARQNQTHFILSHKNDMLFGPLSSLKKTKGWPDNMQLIAVKDDSTCSLMDGDLKTIVPFKVYDKIDLLSEYRNIYRVFKNKKTGIIDSTGKLIIPLLYDEIIAGNTNYLPSINYIYKLNGRYGVISAKGEIVLKADYELAKNKSKDLHFLINNDALYMRIAYKDTIQKINFLFKNAFGNFYRNQDFTVLIKRENLGGTTWAYFNNSCDTISLGSHENILWLRKGSLKEQNVHVFNASGTEIFPGKLRDVLQNNSANLQTLETRNKHFGLINSSSGRLILDTIYTALHITSDKPGRMFIWGRSATTGDYQAFDAFGKPYMSTVFDTIPSRTGNGNYFSGSSKGRKGLLDSNLRWIVEPHYKEVKPISDEFSYVITKGGHIGIINHSNQVMIDTIYTDFMPVFSNIQESLFVDNDTINGFTSDKKEMWWMLSHTNNRVLFNDKGKSILSGPGPNPYSALIDSMLFQFAFRGEYFDPNIEIGDYYNRFIKADGSHNISEGAFKIVLDKEDKAFLMTQPYIKELYTILEKSYHEERAGLYYGNDNPLYPVSTQKHKPDTCRIKRLYVFGENFISLWVRELKPGMISFGNTYYTFTEDVFYDNYILKSGKLHKMEISNIFGSGNVLQEELLLAISKNDSLELDCSSPEGLTKIAQRYFSLSKKGITFYFPGSNYDKSEVVIPLERLKAHKETEWIISYLK